MAMATFKDHFLKYSNRKYFTTGAEEITLGTYGRKRIPIAAANYLQKWKDLEIDSAHIDNATVVDLDFSRSSEAKLKAHLKKKGLGEADAKGQFSRLQSGSLKVMKLSVSTGDMVDALNADKDVFDKLNDFRPLDRVCHEIFVVIEATLAEKIEASGSLSASGSKGDITVDGSVSGGGSSSNNLTISAGTTLAYGMLKLRYDARPKKATRISGAKPDQYGS